LKESRDASVYRLIACKGKNRNGAEIAFTSPIRLEIRFTRKGESNAPTALASICAKYLRELSMDAFNEFWRRAIDKSLKPTAGYPVDALRFRADVKETREQLGISDALFWRKK
jgi:ribonuclease HII